MSICPDCQGKIYSPSALFNNRRQYLNFDKPLRTDTSPLHSCLHQLKSFLNNDWPCSNSVSVQPVIHLPVVFIDIQEFTHELGINAPVGRIRLKYPVIFN